MAAGALVMVASNALALDSVSYGEKVIGPKKHSGTIGALGPDLFGEEISDYTGGISFSQTDLSLPGNDQLSVAVVRRLVVDGNKSPSRPIDEDLWKGYSFGEWELDLPYLSATHAENQGWVVNTSTPNNRCSSPTNYDQFAPQDTHVGEVHFSHYNFWSGINLNIPGRGEQKLLFRPAGGPIPKPTGTSWTALTTASHWFFPVWARSKAASRERDSWLWHRTAPNITSTGWWVISSARSMAGDRSCWDMSHNDHSG